MYQITSYCIDDLIHDFWLADYMYEPTTSEIQL